MDDTGGPRVAAGDLLVRYLNRRLPWGTRWWPYAIALGVANVARQLVLPDLSPPAEITVFVLMVLAVGAAVTFGHLLLWPQPRDPEGHGRVRSDVEAVPETVPSRIHAEQRTPVTSVADGPHSPVRAAPSNRWAPWWWWYVVAILGVNYLRQVVVPVGTVPEWAVVLIVLAMSAVLFVAVTWAYRASRR